MQAVNERLVRDGCTGAFASHAAVRPIAARSRLHQRLPARRSREWRAVHARRALDGAGDGEAGRRRSRRRAYANAQPSHASPDAQRRSHVHGRALRRGRRRLRRAGHEGRGGWTWYTGSASWSYRAALEGMLGFEKAGSRLRFDPCIPATWPGFTLDYRHGTASYAIDVRNPDGVSRGVATVTVDGIELSDGWITLMDDGMRHAVVIALSAGQPVGAMPHGEDLASHSHRETLPRG